MENIYDGIQRPLQAIQQQSKGITIYIQSFKIGIYIPRGVACNALDRQKGWDFVPLKFKVGDHITAGDVFADVHENSLLKKHSIMVPARALGTVTYIAQKGSYTVNVTTTFTLFSGE